MIKRCKNILNNSSLNFILQRMASSGDFQLNFDNQSLKKLPTDYNVDNSVRKVKGYCFVRVNLSPVLNPKLVALSSSALKLLGITDLDIQNPDFIEYFAGNKCMRGSEPSAHCYCGHQFGYFAGQLGDGAVIYLGEVINDAKDRWEFQLKGTGLTPFSRTADGRKVLRSSIREFLCSEAMHFLNVPTTRAGTCITSDSRVWRDVFYDGHPTNEQCAIISRIAPTFIRFGSFEIAKGADRITGNYGPSVSQPKIVQTLCDFVIKSFYPQIWIDDVGDKNKMYIEFYSEVVKRTAFLVAKWQCIGFCHGVLNTDNMSIFGLTIDYGPFGFMDRFDPSHICNASDTGGRYTYKKQPEICRWNLQKLAEALQAFVSMAELIEELQKFDSEFEKCFLRGMRNKLGLLLEDSEDNELIDSFLNTMQMTGADFTNSFRCLSDFDLSNQNIIINSLLNECCDIRTIVESYKPQMDEQTLSILTELAQRDPQMSINNRQVQHLIDTEIQKIQIYNQYKDMSEDEKHDKDGKLWTDWLHKYNIRLAKETFTHRQRKILMDSNNPKFILRNHLLQKAIELAEDGDFSHVLILHKLSKNPFQHFQDLQTDEDSSMNSLPNSCSSFYSRPTSNMTTIKVT